MDRESHAGGSSGVPSPTDTRRRSRADEQEGLSESFQSTDTVRRRPEAAGTTTYGAIQAPSALQSPTTPSASLYLTESGTSAHDRSHSKGAGPPSGQQSTAIRSPIPRQADRGRPGPRKPAMMRRASSNAQAPHRGEVFSVDDGILEVEAVRNNSYIGTARRRTAATPLPRVESSREEDDEEAQQSQPSQPESKPSTKPSTTQPDDSVRVTQEDEPEGDQEDDEETPVEEGVGQDDDDELSDAESFTLKDRQQAINETHPFGIRIWKPALYKKDRSVQKTAEGDIHSTPGEHVSHWLLFFNIIWTMVFGWWLALFAASGAVICLLFAAAPSGRDYGKLLWGLAGYVFYPFGKFVRLELQEAYLEEDQGEGRSISEYEQWQSGDLEYGRLFFGPDRSRSLIGRSRRSMDSEASETDSLLGHRSRGHRRRDDDEDTPKLKRRLFGRGQWNIGRVIFFLFFWLLITPSLFLVSAICWFLVFWIPMGKVTILLFDHLRRHPLAMSFESDITAARNPTAPHSTVIVCTYRAVGLKYWKYTIDGTNIFLINLMAIVVFVIFDWMVLDRLWHIEIFLTSPAFLFVAGLFSIIPLAYFIGQAVASISAQSSMGVGAAINAFFSTIVEVFLYCVALSQGKAQLVEGSVVGSIFAGILFLPGISMCFGAIKRKTQRFNARSAGVTSTMLLFAVVGAFSPTLFYQIYGTHELNCLDCVNYGHPRHGEARDCRRCFFSQTPALDDRFYLEAVRPYCYLAAGMLFCSYAVGLWFTLRTHAAVIWNSEADEKKQDDHGTITHATTRHAPGSVVDGSSSDIRDSHLYKRILGQSLRQAGIQPRPEDSFNSRQGSANGPAPTSHVVPPKQRDTGAGASTGISVHIPGFTEAEDNNLVHQVAELAATAATIAARDARLPRRVSAAGPTPVTTATPVATPLGLPPSHGGSVSHRPNPLRTATFPDAEHLGDAAGGQGAQIAGGHDAPNWGRLKSSIILMGATLLYAIVAEILVDTVDVVLASFAIDEKFLGITLFALVPNTTEFLNAISFAMNGNIALSMEIGSAYALQVCLLQIPALVLFSALYPMTPSGPDVLPGDAAGYTFSLLFPQWDMVTVILCVFLLSYMYTEGKSNYFKGSILLLSYLVVVIGFYFSGYGNEMDLTRHGLGMSRFDVLGDDGQWMSYSKGPEGFKTVGRGTSGQAF